MYLDMIFRYHYFEFINAAKTFACILGVHIRYLSTLQSILINYFKQLYSLQIIVWVGELPKGFQGVAFQPSQTDFYTTFHKICGRP